MENKKTLEYYLQQILIYCSLLNEISKEYSDNEICLDRNLFNSVLVYIENIGEAINHLSNDFKTKHLEVPWRDIVNLRNIIVHDYGDIDPNQIIDTLHIDVPQLEKDINHILYEK